LQFSKRRKDVTANVVVHPSVASLTFDKAQSAFLQSHDAVGNSKVTKADYKTVTKIFLRYMAEKHQYTTMQEITEADVLEWLAHFRNSLNQYGKPYKSNTIATYHRNVRTFFRWLVEHGYLTVNPMEKIKDTKVEKTLIRVFTEEELGWLDAACERALSGRSVTPDERKMLAARDRAIFWVLLSTGIRLSELCGLRFSDIDWDQGMVYVRGKGAKERKVPVGVAARQHLNTYIVYWRGTPDDSSEPVFLTVFGKPVAQSTVKQMFARLKALAGIKDKRVSAHTCRHWFAVTCIKNGMPTIVLKELLGHESWKMIEVYVRLAEQDKGELYARFSPVDGLDLEHSRKDRRQRARDWRNSRKKSTRN
jgi:site-specific recombinase XerD